jgi:hypothetical protein
VSSHLASSTSSSNVNLRLMAEAYILEDIFNTPRVNMASIDEGYLITNISIKIIVCKNSTERDIELTVRAEIRGFHLVVNADEITSLGY